MDFTNVKNFMDELVKERSPGCAIVIYQKGEKVFSYSAGFSDLESKTPFLGKEFVNIYSCSKLATVTAACQLLEKGKFLLNEPLYEYIPEYKNMMVRENDGTIREAKTHITIGDLFSMTAGLNYDMNSPSIKKAGELTGGKYDTLTVVRQLANEPLGFDPGEQYRYSLCHDVLAGLVEIISGMKFRDYVKQNIFEPLGMTQSFYHPTQEILNAMASQYTFVPHGQTTNLDIVGAQLYGSSKYGTFVNVGKLCNLILGDEYDSGGAGVITTVEDYAKFIAALAGYGMGAGGNKILSPFTIDLMKTNRLTEKQRKTYTIAPAVGCGYGLGVRTHDNLSTTNSIAPYGEFGWGGAAGATAFADTNLNLGVFFVQHCLNPREQWYQPRLRNVVYSCLKK
jgi:CubicO group peptidase (beta-lactamase class C family)